MCSSGKVCCSWLLLLLGTEHLPSFCRLVFEGRVMYDENQAKDYNIEGGSVIHLVRIGRLLKGSIAHPFSLCGSGVSQNAGQLTLSRKCRFLWVTTSRRRARCTRRSASGAQGPCWQEWCTSVCDVNEPREFRARGGMTVKVKTRTGKELEIDFEPTDTIWRIKKRIEEKLGIPPDEQR